MTLRPESFGLTLTLGGRYAGEQSWVITPERSAMSVRVQTDFGGVLPQLRRVQHSRIHPRLLTSLHYSEGDGRGRPNFEAVFDCKAGVVSLRQGREEASEPLTTDYHDPLSLLMWLRREDLSQGEARLTGGKVRIQRLPGSEVEGVPCRVYLLRPGAAYVYVEDAPAGRLLRLIQPTDFGAIEANAQPERRAAPSERRRRRR